MTNNTIDILHVRFEYGSSAENIASFYDEETYKACVPALEKLAKKNNAELSEAWETVYEYENIMQKLKELSD